MEDERNTQSHQGGEADQVEVTDRGFFNNLVGKKEEEKKHEEELAAGVEKVSLEEPEVKKEEHEGGEKHESLFTKLQRSSSSSSSSSDEEEVIDDNGEVIKRKKKKGLKEKLKEKLPGHKDATEGQHATGLPAPAPPAALHTHDAHHDTAVPVEKIHGDDVKTEAPPAAVPEEEKGFLEKIKEKLPGGHKKPEDAAAAPVTHAAPAPVHAPAPAAEEASSPDAKEKGGILGKIMDKLPGYHKAAGEEDKAAAAAGDHKTSA